MAKTNKRTARIARKTKETEISINLNIDGKGKARIATGIGFLDHMLELFAFHGLFDLEIKAKGDLKVDTHHTNEDIGICLGQAFKKALGDCVGIKRFGSSEVPMGGAGAKVTLDISNRHAWRFSNSSEIQNFDYESEKDKYSLRDGIDFLNTFSKNLNMNLHIEILSGTDLHHVLEAVFKALGIALDQATQIDPRRKEVPSSKGIL